LYSVTLFTTQTSMIIGVGALVSYFNVHISVFLHIMQQIDNLLLITNAVF